MTERLDVRVPDDPPPLSPAGWRTLLDVLTAEAEERWGPDWRQRLLDESGGRKTAG